jgi:hypothetical protein
MDERSQVRNVTSGAGPVAHPGNWESFEAGLAAALAVLGDEILILSARTGNRYVQFASSAGKGVLAETGSNAYLAEQDRLDAGQVAALLGLGWSQPTHAPDADDPVPGGSPNHFRRFRAPVPFAEVARLAVRTLSEVLRVRCPDELRYKAFDGDGHPLTLPGLGLERVPAPARRPGSPPRRRAGGALTRLRARVLAAARAATGLGALDYDGEGNLQIPVGNRTGWVRPCDGPLFVRVHVHLLSDVEADEALLARMHEVNARLPMARVIHVDGSVFLGVDFPALPFRPEHLAQAVGTIARFADDVVSDLRPPELSGADDGTAPN